MCLAGQWLTNGNFDDPSGGHGLGQPFAWDFTFPFDGGAKVLAARAGTVIDLRGNSTKVLPNGVDDLFWGPGNYVAIQHADRTIASYDHMHPE
jgi:murein DD-endopeptidase MepM/ murein hydrolase activator NlpD